MEHFRFSPLDRLRYIMKKKEGTKRYTTKLSENYIQSIAGVTIFTVLRIYRFIIAASFRNYLLIIFFSLSFSLDKVCYIYYKIRVLLINVITF